MSFFDIYNNDSATSRNNDFSQACLRGDLDAVKRLVEAGADINTVRSDMPSLLLAANGQHWEICKFLIDRQVNLNCENLHGWSPLHIFAQQGHEELCRRACEEAAYVNRRDRRGQTPLYVAAVANQLETVKLLLSQGADPRNLTRERDTCMHAAARNGNAEMCQALSAAGALAHAENDAGETPITLAATDDLRAVLEAAELSRAATQAAQAREEARAEQAAESGEASTPATTQPGKRRLLKA